MIGPALELGSKLIDRLWADAEQRDQARMQLMKLQQVGELKELEVAMSAIIAEAKSQDKWTSRARPSFLYIIYLVILLCVVGGVLGIWWPDHMAQVAHNMNTLLMAVPDSLWSLFGVGYLGYSAARSFDKTKLQQ